MTPRTHEMGWIVGTLLGVFVSLGFFVATTKDAYIGFLVGAGAAGALGFGLRNARQQDSEMPGYRYPAGQAKVSVFSKEYDK